MVPLAESLNEGSVAGKILGREGKPVGDSGLGWVVDIGGTNIRLALMRRGEGAVVEQRLNTPASPEPERVLDVIEALMTKSRVSANSAEGIVLGVPGLVDPGLGMAIQSGNLGWRRVPIRALAEARFGLPVRIENDVHLHTLGEWKIGAGRHLGPQDRFVDVVIGTGVAAGIVVHGQLVRGPGVGEIGHLTWDRHGARCGCGKIGCVETVVGAKGITRIYQSLGYPTEDFLGQVVQPLEAGEPWASRVWQEFVQALAFSLSAVIMVVNPTMIVLSGGLVASFPHWGKRLREALDQELFVSMRERLKLVTSRLGDRAPFWGGSFLLFDDIGEGNRNSDS